jgi:hypothetical protein
MAMKTRHGLLGAALLASLIGCTPKPSQEACEKAVLNIRRLTGDTHTEAGPVHRAAVRSCQSQSTRDTAECYERAQTKEELFSCGGDIAEAVRATEAKGGAPTAEPVKPHEEPPGTAGAGANDTAAPPPASQNDKQPPPPVADPSGAPANPSESGSSHTP